MISVIADVSNKQDFEKLKRNLIALEPDWNLGMDLLCIVEQPELYEEVRSFLKKSVDRGQCLVFQDECGLKASVRYLEYKNEWVFLMNDKAILPSGTITALKRNYLDNPTAGMITGVVSSSPSVYWVKDIYEPSQYIYSNDFEQGLVEIDTAWMRGVLTKKDTFVDLFGLDELKEYGSLSYGIRLRRQGYKNYLNSTLKYREEE